MHLLEKIHYYAVRARHEQWDRLQDAAAREQVKRKLLGEIGKFKAAISSVKNTKMSSKERAVLQEHITKVERIKKDLK